MLKPISSQLFIISHLKKLGVYNGSGSDEVERKKKDSAID
jgi:hypothetical protein